MVLDVLCTLKEVEKLPAMYTLAISDDPQIVCKVVKLFWWLP